MSNIAPAKTNFWITVAALVGGFAIFALILLVAYLPQKPAPVGEGAKTQEERVRLLNEQRANEKTAATSYGWVDQTQGVVRLPLDRAVELTIQEINQKKK